MKKAEIFRLLDANLNRLGESLKIIEDISRFVLAREKFFKKIKAWRQNLIKIVKKIMPVKILLPYRNVTQDLGASYTGSEELKRKNWQDVLTAEFKRAQESARLLEEFGKTISATLSSFFKKLRFELYRLEKEFFLNSGKKKLLDFNLYLILDTSVLRPAEIIKLAKKAVKAKIKIIQLRAKGWDAGRFLKLAQKIRKITLGNALFIVNDRTDIAWAAAADGVHLGPDDVSISAAREILGDDKIIGFSVAAAHSSIKAEKKGADYLGAGAVFKTPTKPGKKVIGIKGALTVQKAVKIPVFAIGGINETNLESLMKAGIKKVAVVRALAQPGNFEKKLRLFKKFL